MTEDEQGPAWPEEVAARYRRVFRGGASTERTVFFSDAVFAIAMTLLVLDLHAPPDLGQDRLGAVLVEALPRFFAYALSFAVIGAAWMSHHGKFTVVRRYDAGLQWLNLLLLFFVALLPMPTSFISEYGGGSSPWPVVLYAAVTASMHLVLDLIWVHAWHAGLVAHEVDAALYRYVLLLALPVPVVFVLSIPVAFLDPSLAMNLWWLIIPAMLVGGRVLRRTGGR